MVSFQQKRLSLDLQLCQKATIKGISQALQEQPNRKWKI